MSQVGDMLRDAREARGLTIADVAAGTHIKRIYLEALESGDYSHLPGAAYTTGFLRNYARFVGLHPDDVLAEYHTGRPVVVPEVRPATRVLAQTQSRWQRERILWMLGVITIIMGGAFAIKQYNDNYAHAYSPQIQVTPSNLGGRISAAPPLRSAPPPTVRLRLTSLAPVWVQVTADGQKVYASILRPGHSRVWLAHRNIYVVTLDGSHLRAVYDRHPVGVLAKAPGLMVGLASPSGWHRVS